MPPTLSNATRTQTLVFIAADDYYDDSEKDLNGFVSNAEEASGVMEMLQTVYSFVRPNMLRELNLMTLSRSLTMRVPQMTINPGRNGRDVRN